MAQPATGTHGPVPGQAPDRCEGRPDRGAAAAVRVATALVLALLTALLVGPAPAAQAATATGFVAPGASASVQLRNGLVLVAGGCESPGHCPSVITSAWLYDPRTRQARPTGATITPHGYATLTLLSSGKALLAGGCQGRLCGQANPAAEVWDPATGRWTATRPMLPDASGDGITPEHAAAVLLTSGDVLVAGGVNYTQLAQVWSPRTGTWRRTAAMRAPRESLTVTRLSSGRVLAVGGCDYYYCETVLASAEVYDPATDRWTATGSLHQARWGHTATLLPGRQVQVSGGIDASYNPVTAVEVWNPVTGTWSTSRS